MSIKAVIASGDPEKIASYMKENNLRFEGNKIVHQNKETVENMIEFWDKRQLVKKINLNS